MKRIAKFKLIARLVNNRANIAAKELAEATNEYNKKLKKLDELHYIIDDYKNRLNKINQKVSAEKFQQNQKFIEYLEYVILQQMDVVAAYKNEVLRKRQIWIYCHKQNKGLKSYLSEVESEIMTEKQKKEQKELDSIVTDNYVLRSDSDS